MKRTAAGVPHVLHEIFLPIKIMLGKEHNAIGLRLLFGTAAGNPVEGSFLFMEGLEDIF